MSIEALRGRAMASLSPAETAGSIGYLDIRSFGPGAPLLIDRQPYAPDRVVRAVFVDLAPAANWAHPARWLLLPEDGSAVVALDASFPPFWGGGDRHLELLWVGTDAPAWAVAVQPRQG